MLKKREKFCQVVSIEETEYAEPVTEVLVELKQEMGRQPRDC